MGKKLVTVPGLKPKTQIFVDESLEGEDLKLHFKQYIENLNKMSSDEASAMWKRKLPVSERGFNTAKKRGN